MRILLANFKLLYQRDTYAMVCVGLGLLAMVAGTGVLSRKEGAAGAAALWMYVAAMFLAGRQVDVLVMPFSWCLPGHRKAAGKFLFLAGCVFSVIWAAIYMLRAGGHMTEGVSTGIAVLMVTSAVYSSVVWIVFGVSPLAAALILAAIVLVCRGIPGGKYFDLIVGDVWLYSSVIGGAVNFLVWRTLPVAGFIKRYRGQPTLGGMDSSSPEQRFRFTRARMAQGEARHLSVRPGVERFFLRRIEGGSSPARYVWGNLYRSCAVMLSDRKKWLYTAFLIAVFACCICYMSVSFNMLFVFSGVVVTHMRLGIHSSMLICGGRRERFWSALILAVVASLFVTGVATVSTGVSALVEPIMPELSLLGRSRVFRALDMKLFFVPLAMVPATLAVSLMFCKRRKLAAITTALLFVGTMGAAGMMTAVVSRETATVNASATTVLVLACWGLFAGVLRYVCMRRCLVR